MHCSFVPGGEGGGLGGGVGGGLGGGVGGGLGGGVEGGVSRGVMADSWQQIEGSNPILGIKSHSSARYSTETEKI